MWITFCNIVAKSHIEYVSEDIMEIKNQKLILENRQKLNLTGVDKVDNITPTLVCCKVGGDSLNIEGENMEVTRLDVEAGNVEIVGQINAIKYAVEKKSLIKRIFK